jgi:hypothetical protein
MYWPKIVLHILLMCILLKLKEKHCKNKVPDITIVNTTAGDI